MNSRSLLALVSLALVAACNADDLVVPTTVEQTIPGSYIVTVVNGVDPAVVAADNGIVPTFVYTDAIHGFAAMMSDAQHAKLLTDVRVKAIEADEVEVEETTQTGASWGIDRVDQRALPLSGSYTYTSTGTGVTVYIVDTGINISHEEFGGRASEGVDEYDRRGGDCNGHGTHVASIAGGAVYGMAKAVKLVSVRVLGCGGTGSTSGVVAGVDWITRTHPANSVANMSLGGGVSAALDAAVQASIESGVTYVFAAGNDNRNSCNYSPPRIPAGITVGATYPTDQKTSYSNFGECLDIWAPGSNIAGAWIGSNTATKTISGTSMAAPFVAGAAALYIARNPGAKPQQVRDALVNGATMSIIANIPTAPVSPNALLFSNY